MKQRSDPVEVAVGVIYDRDERVLVNQRPAGKPFAGKWEFPGGKVEPGETPEQALVRELNEELLIDVGRHRPLISFVHDYADNTVRLDVFEILDHDGIPESREGQALAWARPEELDGFDMLEANAGIVRAVALPRICLITDTQLFGYDRTLDRLQHHVDHNRVLLIIREKTLDRNRLRTLVDTAVSITRPSRSLVCVHADCDFDAYESVDGVHRSAGSLLIEVPPVNGALSGVSCHSCEELNAAAGQGASYAFLSPVSRTASHPAAEPLGWSNFHGICRDTALPVYALGGMKHQDFLPAIEHGAQGVAMLGAAWD